VSEGTSEEFKNQVRKLRDTLQKVDFLYALKVEELDHLMAALKKRKVPAGMVVIKQGEPGDAFFMIAAGKVSVWDGAKQITSRYEGEFFGESALVTDSPRSATVKAEKDCELYVLYKEDFNRILMHNANIAQAIRQATAQRKIK
jgi:cAMP-dependent protein kinase regulator